jgi:ankyrin repeat protein
LFNNCVAGNPEEVKKLLQQSEPRLDVNWTNADGSSAVHVAVNSGHDKCLSVLIRYAGGGEGGEGPAADLSRTNKQGYAPIHMACNQKDGAACLALLLDHGVDANQCGGGGGITPMILCCMKGNVEGLALLLDKGANTELMSRDGNTPVIVCCTHGNVESLALLLDKGANPDLADGNGVSPAHHACVRGHFKCLELLIAKGANCFAKDREGRVPLEYAKSDISKNSDCIALLLMHVKNIHSVEDPTLYALPAREQVRLRYQ